jgi:hypothetical protein
VNMTVGARVCKFPRSLKCGVVIKLETRTQNHPTPMSPSWYTVYTVLWDDHRYPGEYLHEDLMTEEEAWG